MSTNNNVQYVGVLIFEKILYMLSLTMSTSYTTNN